MLHTTLEVLRRNHVCLSGYKALIAILPKDYAVDAPITLLHILESNGIKDAIWALRATIEPTGKPSAKRRQPTIANYWRNSDGWGAAVTGAGSSRSAGEF